jgi:hypothetical protein
MLKISLLLAGTLVAIQAQAGIVFTIEAPGVQETTVVGASTETFNSVPLGLIGTYFSPAIGGTYSGGQVIAADVYGGAHGTPYDVVGLNRTRTQILTFASPKTYFGMWWSAGDASNQLEFYDGAALLAHYAIGDIIPFLAPAYYGNPNGGGNASEPYVYLDFTTTGASRISEVRFINLTGSGYETDNHSVFDKPIDPPGHGIPDATATLGLLGSALAALALIRRR